MATKRSTIASHGFLLLIAVLSLAPLAMIWMTSLKTNAELTLNPLGLPRQWRISNFADAWETANLGRYLLNSILTTLPTLGIVLTCASLAGYALARLRFVGAGLLFALFLIGLMVPNVSLVVPLYYT